MSWPIRQATVSRWPLPGSALPLDLFGTAAVHSVELLRALPSTKLARGWRGAGVSLLALFEVRVGREFAGQVFVIRDVHINFLLWIFCFECA